MPGGFRRKRAREQGRVRVDVNGMMRSVVGDDGLGDEEVASFAPRFDALVGLERRLGFPPLPAKSELKRTLQLTDEIREAFDDLVVLANRDVAAGVRALVAAVAREGATPDRPALRVHLVEGLDPDRLASVLARLDLRRSLFDVVSAAGDALETISQFLIVRDRLLKELGAVEYKQHVVITTAAGEGALRQIVNDEGFRDVPFPADVEDRFAALTPAALFPAACAGADLTALAAGAADMAERCGTGDVATNPARLLAIALRGARSCAVVPTAAVLEPLAAWIECASAPVGTRTGRAPLVLFVDVEDRRHDAEIPKTFQDLESIGYLGGQRLATLAHVRHQAEEMALWSAGRPTVRVVCPHVDEYATGQLASLVQSAVALARGLADATPEPEAATGGAERLAYGLAGRPGYEAERAEAQRLAGRREARYVV